MCHQDPTYDRLSREEATSAEQGLGAVSPTIFEPPTYHQWMATGVTNVQRASAFPPPALFFFVSEQRASVQNLFQGNELPLFSPLFFQISKRSKICLKATSFRFSCRHCSFRCWPRSRRRTTNSARTRRKRRCKSTNACGSRIRGGCF